MTAWYTNVSVQAR
uniref:Uncharacterized protein n=1 Tax=Anguilla anguilla TaxID=7936 RepID=A0A0E9RQ18_ANGAN